jgi:hypothetical protein
MRKENIKIETQTKEPEVALFCFAGNRTYFN